MRASFLQIAQTFERLGWLLVRVRSASLTPAETPGKPARRRLRLFLARRRARILQARYIG